MVLELQFLHGIRVQGCSSSTELRSYLFSLSECIHNIIPLWRRACIKLKRFSPSFYLCRLQRESPRAHQLLSMDYSSSMIMTPFNYHEWKSKIGTLLHSKGLYRVYMDLEIEPNYIVEKDKWHNRLDESYGFIFLFISPDLIFHLHGLTTPKQVYWPNLSLSLKFKTS